MKKLLLFIVAAVVPIFAQPPCVTISDTLYSVGTGSSVAMNGTIDLSLGYSATDGSFTVVQSVGRQTVTSGVITGCFVPGSYSAAYTVRRPAPLTGNSTFMRYWTVPATGGPYKLSDTPVGASGPIEQQTFAAPFPATIAGAQGPVGPQGPTGPPATQSFATSQDAGVDVLCAVGADTIGGITCNNSANATSETAFNKTVTITAGTLANNVTTVNFSLGHILSGSGPAITTTIKLGNTAIFTSPPQAQGAGAVTGASTLSCTISAPSAASASAPLITSCAIQSLYPANNIVAKNVLISNTTLFVNANTAADQVLSLFETFSAATHSNAVWLYSISPGSGGATGPSPGVAFGYSFPAGSVAGATAYLIVPFACTIRSWNMTSTAGTATIDVWKVASGSGLPLVGNSITASAIPAIASGTTATSTTLTGWTTSVAAMDTFAFNLKAISGVQATSLVLGCK